VIVSLGFNSSPIEIGFSKTNHPIKMDKTPSRQLLSYIEDVWIKARPQKYVAFIWSIWHNAIAINSWQAQTALGIDTSCH